MICVKLKKIFICSVKGMNTNYSVLANSSNEAKKNGGRIR